MAERRQSTLLCGSTGVRQHACMYGDKLVAAHNPETRGFGHASSFRMGAGQMSDSRASARVYGDPVWLAVILGGEIAAEAVLPRHLQYVASDPSRAKGALGIPGTLHTRRSPQHLRVETGKVRLSHARAVLGMRGSRQRPADSVRWGVATHLKHDSRAALSVHHGRIKRQVDFDVSRYDGAIGT